MAKTKRPLKRFTDAEIRRQSAVARARATAERKAGVLAAAARYDRATNRIEATLTNGVAVGFPVSMIPELRDATPEQLGAVTLSPSGSGLHWDDLDVHVSVPGLLAEAFGSGAFLSVAGRLGGRVRSDAKAAAARANGAKGGRPRKKAAR